MSKVQPLVSIIMPVYNSEKYISEAIESVCNQSYKKLELLIVNDGSTDRSSEIIEKYAKNDSRIKVINKENEGVSEARNHALNHIGGEYVAFIDSDDIYHSDRLKRMLRVFDKHPDCDLVFSRHKEFKGKLNILEEVCSEKIEIYDENILEKTISDLKNHFVWNAMLKSEIATSEKFSMMHFGEDFCYIRDCTLHCKKVAVLNSVLYFYRRDNENSMTSHFFSEKYIMDYMKRVKNTYDFCEKNKLQDVFYKNMVAHEYAQNSMRVRKCTSYLKFVNYMNDEEFREGIKFADASNCTIFEKILFFMVKHKIYIPFAFWVW